MEKLTWLFIFELSLIFSGGAFFFFYFSKLPPELPWFYSLPWGEGQLIPKIWFGVGLIILAAICVLNFLISKRLKRADSIMALVVGWASLLLIIFYLASFFRVLSIML